MQTLHSNLEIPDDIVGKVTPADFILALLSLLNQFQIIERPLNKVQLINSILQNVFDLSHHVSIVTGLTGNLNS
jgi:hypothetical protein